MSATVLLPSSSSVQKASIVPVSTGSMGAAESLSFALWACMAPLIPGSSTWILSLCELCDESHERKRGVLSEGLDTSDCGLSEWQGVWGRSLCIGRTGGRGCQIVGSTHREVGLSN